MASMCVDVLSPLVINLLIRTLTDAVIRMLCPEELQTFFTTSIVAALTIPVWVLLLCRDTAARSVKDKNRQGLLLTVAALPAGMLLSLLFGKILQLLPSTWQLTDTGQEQLMAAPPILQAVGLCILVPVSEELLYRGLFRRRLEKYCTRRVAGLISAVCFAAGHGSPLRIAYAFCMALLLNLLCDKTDGLTAPILMHAGANLMTVCAPYL